jgi:hypothetical protein
VTVPSLIQDFVLLHGSPATYVKTGDSGAKRGQVFCSRCGSPLYTYSVEQPRTYGLRVGCIAQKAALVPTKQVWCQSALSWTMHIDPIAKRQKE